MIVFIYSRVFKKKDAPYIQHLFDLLHEYQFTTFVHTPYLEQINDHIDFPRKVGTFDDGRDFKIREVDFVITLGGDGTILHAATLIFGNTVPIVGINLGRLGFLASVSKDYIRSCIIHMHTGDYIVESRRLLQLECNSQEPIFDGKMVALNDFTILKRDTSSMITIHTYINGEFLNSYWADGIIVATPTGSTGYSLSCGGPIIFPNSGNFVLTPVAPHNLNVRPIVISDKSVLSFEVEGRAENYLCTLDSRFETVTSDFQFAIRRADHDIKLVRFPDREFLWTIREKLDWGKDSRN